MAVIAVWKCDRDGAMFDNKKDADEHDKMLELAANITFLIEKNIDIDEKQSEAIGILLAKYREKLAIACKGKPDVLLEDLEIEDAKASGISIPNKTASGSSGRADTHKENQNDSHTENQKSSATITTLAANQ